MIYEKEQLDHNRVDYMAELGKQNIILENEGKDIVLPEELVCIEHFGYNDKYSYFDMDPRVRAGGYVWQRKAIMVKGEPVLAEDQETSRSDLFSIWREKAVIKKTEDGTDVLTVNILDGLKEIVIGQISYDDTNGKYTCEGFVFG